MMRFLALVFNVIAYVMTTSIAVYVGVMTANNPHASPFGGYFNAMHLLYLLGYLSICAAFYYLSDRLN